MTAIRAALVKGRSSGDPVYAAAEETSEELKERISQLHQIQKLPADGNGTGISPARVTMTAASTLTHVSSSPLTRSPACSSSSAKSVRCESRHCIRRARHGEGAAGAAG